MWLEAQRTKVNNAVNQCDCYDTQCRKGSEHASRACVKRNSVVPPLKLEFSVCNGLMVIFHNRPPASVVAG